DSGVQLFNFYVFNITNPYEVLNGSIPQLQEIGPFIYRRFEFKNDVVFSEDSCTVSYRYSFSFEFQEDMTNSQNSVGINETVTVLNPGVLTFFNTMNTGFALTSWAEYFNSLPGIKLFYQVTIQDIILGVGDPGLAKISFKSVDQTKYGLLNQASINMVERTGYCDRYDLRVLEEIWNTTNISYWSSMEDVKVNYTFDEVVYSNGLEMWRFKCFVLLFYFILFFIYIYVHMLCIMYFFLFKYAIYGFLVNYLPSPTNCAFACIMCLRRWKVSDNTLKNATNYPYNAQYFAFGHDGLLNFSVRKEIPEQTMAYLSFPHFYQGEYYVKHVEEVVGLDAPNPDTDATYFDLEPQTGIVIRNWLAFQTNFQLFPLMENISYINSSNGLDIMVTNFSNLPNFLVPMGYQVINAYAPSDVTQSLATSLTLLRQLKDTSFYGGISFGVVLVALSVWLICRRYQKILH
ncbi:hypothetical protein RFI_12901, partial [Reticulomyxa filosa]